MPEIVPVIFYGAEGYTAEPVDFENVLCSGWGRDDEDVGLFADADLVASAVEGFAFEVRVEGEVVEAAVGETVSII